MKKGGKKRKKKEKPPYNYKYPQLNYEELKKVPSVKFIEINILNKIATDIIRFSIKFQLGDKCDTEIIKGFFEGEFFKILDNVPFIFEQLKILFISIISVLHFVNSAK